MDSIYGSDGFDFGWSANNAVYAFSSVRAESVLFHIRDAVLFAGTPVVGVNDFLGPHRPTMHDYDMVSYETFSDTVEFIRFAADNIHDAQHVTHELPLRLADGTDTQADVCLAILEINEGAYAGGTFAVLAVVDPTGECGAEALIVGARNKAASPDFALSFSHARPALATSVDSDGLHPAVEDIAAIIAAVTASS